MKKMIFIKSIFNALFLLTTYIVLLICVWILISAFINIKNTNQEMIIILNSFPKYFPNDLSPQIKALLDQIEFKSKNSFDTTTIAFIFQLFSIGLVSTGLYFLNRTKDDLDRMKKEYEKMKLIYERTKRNYEEMKKDYKVMAVEHSLVKEEQKKIQNNYQKIEKSSFNAFRKAKTIYPISLYAIYTMRISSRLSDANLYARLLLTVSKEEIKLITVLRDTIHNIKEEFIKADCEKVGFEMNQNNSYLDQVYYLKQNLIKLKMDELVKECESILKILEKSSFVERYNWQIQEVEKED